MRAASDTIWSNAGWMKSANSISATGRSPCSDIPIASPTIIDSASGVSMTRCSPNSSTNPCVILNTPPRAAMSSPSTTMRSSDAISSWRVSWIAVTTFFSVTSALGVAAELERGRVRVGRVPRVVDLPVDVLADPGSDALERLLVGGAVFREVGGEDPDRILVLGLLDLLARAVRPVVVVRGMREEAVGLGLDQRRAVAGAGALDRLLHRAVARERVAAVHDHAGESIRLGAVGHVLDRHLLGLRHRDRIVVVLADEHDRQLVDAGEVEPLVPVALARRALAEPARRDGLLAAILRGVRDAGRVRDLRPDRARVRDDAEPPGAPVRRHLPAAGARIVGLREQPQEDVLRSEPGDENDGEVAVVGEPDVAAALERVRRPDLTPLVSRDGNDERRLALPVESEGGFVTQSRRDDVPVHREEVVGIEAEGLV